MIVVIWVMKIFFVSSVYSCHFFLISSAYVRSMPFLSFIEPIFAWNVPLVSLIFLKSSLVFPNLLFSSISLLWSLRKAFLTLLAILWNLIDRVPDELWMEVHDIVRETGIETIPKKKKCKKTKWLSGEALQIAVKRGTQKAKEKRKDKPILMQSSKE